MTRKFPETDLEVLKDQYEVNVRSNADKQKVSEADLEIYKDQDQSNVRIKVISGSRLIQGETLRLTLGPRRIRMKENVRINVYTWRVPETNLEV